MSGTKPQSMKGLEERSPSGARVVVTGGAGFLGSELVRQLVAEECSVAVVDNLVNGRRENLADVPGATLIVADVRDREQAAKYLHGADVVFHLACLGVRHSLHAPHENHEVNATGTLSVLEAARSAGVGRFVYVSSSEVYGGVCRGAMTEDHPTVPTTVYGASKLAGEHYTRAYHATHGLSTVVIRPFNAYGPRCHHEGDCGEVIPRFMLRCLAGWPMIVFGDGRQTRDFTYVSDTARGILRAGFCDAAVGRTLNLASGTEVAIRNLADAVAGACATEARVRFDPPRPGDLPRLCGDASRARSLLGYAPRVSLEEGLRRMREWYAALDRPVAALLEEEIVHNWKPRVLSVVGS